jgi:hypothetical protein
MSSNTSLCIKETGNWGKLEKKHKFDNKDFDEKKVKDDLSPKMIALLENISELDKKDMKEHGHLFKHFIYSDIKSSFGAKLIASVLTSGGFEHAYSLQKTARGMSFTLDNVLLKKRTSNVFATLTSVAFFEKPIGVNFRKEILKTFNSRPENVHGEHMRIIILDSGFREGIDLFDVKYVHLVEPIATKADQKQAIGRGTRFCGQKGIEFHKKEGWPLHVYRYETLLSDNFKNYLVSNDNSFENVATFFDMFMKYSNLDPKKLAFSNELETIVIGSAIDKELTKEVHEFKIPQSGGGLYNVLNKMIMENYGHLAWGKIKIVNGCIQNGGSTLVEFTPTQQFIREYFTPAYPNPGMLLYHSVGTGKTCTAIATASSTFEKEGYSIIYVTRYTLKADVWKNMFDQVCSLVVQEHIKKGMPLPEANAARQRIISDKWFEPMSYKQFSNLLAGKNQLSNVLIERNGKKDILRKTLIIVDEAHKLFASDVEGQEKADIDVIRKALMNSNKVSGKEGAKILLMTATPYTTDAIDMIRLFNLCRPYDKQFPEDFEEFSKLYLDENGNFTEETKERFYDDIAGYTSYLNREKDIRSFAYPVIHNISVPMSGYSFTDKFGEMRRLKMNIKTLDTQITSGTHVVYDKLKKKETELKTTNEKNVKNLRQLHKECVKDSKENNIEFKKKINKDHANKLQVCTKQILSTRKKEIKEEYKGIIKSLKNDAKVLLKEKGLNASEKADIKAKLAEQIEQYKNDEMFDIEQLSNSPDFIKCREDAKEEYSKALMKYAQLPSEEKCKEMLSKIKKIEEENKDNYTKELKELKVKLFTTINQDTERLKKLKKELSDYSKETLDIIEKDPSQQSAIEKCLKGKIKPQYKQLYDGDSNKFSESDLEEIVEDDNKKKNIFLIVGHGSENVVDFNKRNKVPEDKVVVVFPVCARPNYMNTGCTVADMFNNPKFTRFLANPIKYREQIENHIGHPIRLYLPNEYIPNMSTNLFLDFDKEDIVCMKSGVYRINKIPEINRNILPEIRKPNQNLGSTLCKKFTGIMSSPEKYNAKIHNEIFKGNLYPPALRSGKTFKELVSRSFKIDDIINTVGKGIYYYIGCRSSFAPVAETKYDELLKVSDNQQFAKHRSAKIRPILSLLNNSDMSKSISDIEEDSPTKSSSSKSKSKSQPKIVNTKEEVKYIRKFYKIIVTNREDFDIDDVRATLTAFNQTEMVKILLTRIDEKEFIENNKDKIIKRIIIKKVKGIVQFLEKSEIPYKNKNLYVKDDVIGIINTNMINATKKCSGTMVVKKITKMFKTTGEIPTNLPKTIEEASSQDVFERLCIEIRKKE